MKNLDDTEKQKILLEYLREFAVYFDEQEEDLFAEKIKDFQSCVIRADNYTTLKKAICYTLLKQNKKVKYIYMKSNDIIDTMLSDDLEDGATSFVDLQNVPLLIIYHPKIWKKNKILWETLNYLAETRNTENKRTIIISDSYKLYDEHGTLDVGTVINLSYNMTTTNYTPVANFVGTSDCSGLYD